MTLQVAFATAEPTDADAEAKSSAPKATSDEQRASTKGAQPKAAAKQVKLGGNKGKKPKNKKANPPQPRTTIPAGSTVDKRVDFVRPIGQPAGALGGASSGGWPAEIPNKGKRRKGNRKG